MPPPRLHYALLALCLAAYTLISIRHLASVPPVYEDEPWLASTAWKLATEGQFGSDLFTGFYNAEHHNFAFFPLHSLLLAGVFKICGLGLLPMRLFTVAQGLLVLILTYGLGRRLWQPAVGLLAVYLMLSVRLTTLTPSQPSGILFLDIARIGRYDMLVPLFSLAAWHAYLSARSQSQPILYGASGLLAGLAFMSHPNGIFTWAAMMLLALWDRIPWRRLGLIALGFALPILPYGAYVLRYFPDFLGQTLIFSPRFEITNWHWYWNNLLTEGRRYTPGLGSSGWGYVLRPGFWASLVILPLSLAWLAQQGIKGDRSARMVLVPALVIPAGFALLVTLKLINYLVAVLPMVALAAAWGSISFCNKVSPTRWKSWLRWALWTVLLVVSLEGSGRILALELDGRSNTPYEAYIARVRASIPPGSTVLGLHNYWFGMEGYVYRSWALPFLQSGQAKESDPRRLEYTLDEIDPEFLLFDRRMRDFFAQAGPMEGQVASARTWMAKRGATLVETVSDPTYGTMEILRIPR